jgi:hypothetical protein
VPPDSIFLWYSSYGVIPFFKFGVRQKLCVVLCDDAVGFLIALLFFDRLLDVCGLDPSAQKSGPPSPRSRPNLSLSLTTFKALTQPPKTC